MKIRITGSLVLIALITLAVSWHLKLLFFYFLFLILKKYIPYYNSYKRVINWGGVALFIFLFTYTFPSRLSDKDDYIESIYFNKKTGAIVSMPFIPYATNFIGEGDIMTGVALVGKVLPVKRINLGGAIKDIMFYMNNISFTDNNFHTLYRELEREDIPPHNVPFQILQGAGLYNNIEHYFLHKPKYKANEDCEVIIFCHGYAGNWLLYSELFAKYTDAIVIAVESPDFNGNFNKKLMSNIVNNIIPHAFYQLGMTSKKTHLIGLSNGGSAINTAVKYFPESFESYTILSASLNINPKCKSKVNIIYGAEDRSGGVNRDISKTKYTKHIIKGKNHALLVSNPEIVFSYINNIIK